MQITKQTKGDSVAEFAVRPHTDPKMGSLNLGPNQDTQDSLQQISNLYL
jgi:hypothetical protein